MARHFRQTPKGFLHSAKNRKIAASTSTIVIRRKPRINPKANVEMTAKEKDLVTSGVSFQQLLDDESLWSTWLCITWYLTLRNVGGLVFSRSNVGLMLPVWQHTRLLFCNKSFSKFNTNNFADIDVGFHLLQYGHLSRNTWHFFWYIFFGWL